MSRSLLRQILLSTELAQVSLAPANTTPPEEVLLYIGKTNNANPLRLEIEEIEPAVSNTMLIPDILDGFNNPSVMVENSYENLLSTKVCLDNWVNETPSCVGAVHEAHINASGMSSGIFPLELEINGDLIVFPYATTTEAFTQVLRSYGLQVLPTKKKVVLT